ncbi:hypothetical protein AAFC00_006527 [Neodothiora populina]|uniref:Major facilitator superfamily (MFS) profile domain-containing protein n=1 Tax=Neodothiora populina TaxID=2781224 RepID=A0ABR3PAX5_9PEZI
MAEPGFQDQSVKLSRQELLAAFCALSVALFTCFMDQNGVGLALPDIGRDLHAEATVSWAGTSALIANTVFQVLYGRLSDIFGRKVILISALILLSVSDLLCGFAVNSTMLYVFRGLSGVASGGITSLTMVTVSDIVSLQERGKYQGILGSMVGLGNMVGPSVAAAFVQKSTWRGLFWVICPLAAMTSVACMKLLPGKPGKVSLKQGMQVVDWWGLLTGSAAVILILVPISGGGTYFQWESPMVISMLVLGGICAVAFVIVENRVARLPMMPGSVYKDPVVGVLLAQNVLSGFNYYSTLYYVPLFLQNARQLSPVVSASIVIAFPLFQSVFSVLSGQYNSRIGHYGELLWIGFFLWTLGAALNCIFTRDTPITAMVVILACQGAGVGFVFQPILVALQAHCTKANRAVITSNRNFLRCTGGAIGLVASAAVLQARLKNNLPTGFEYLALSSYSAPDLQGTTAAQRKGVLDAYASASRSVFILNVPFMAICLILCLFVKDRGLVRAEEVKDEVKHAGFEADLTSDSRETVAEDADKKDVMQSVEEKSETKTARTRRLCERVFRRLRG